MTTTDKITRCMCVWLYKYLLMLYKFSELCSGKEVTVNEDEGYKQVNFDKLRTLQPAFQKDGNKNIASCIYDCMIIYLSGTGIRGLVKRANTLSRKRLVVNEEMMRPGQWLEYLLWVFFSALTLLHSSFFKNYASKYVVVWCQQLPSIFVWGTFRKYIARVSSRLWLHSVKKC